MTLFPKQNLFALFFLLDSLRNIVWTVFDQYFGQPPEVLWTISNTYFGQPPKSIVDNLRYVLWFVSEKYCGQSSIRTLVSLLEVLWTIFDTYFGQSPRSTVDNLQKSFAFLIYHRTPNIGSIISMHSHPCHAMPHA